MAKVADCFAPPRPAQPASLSPHHQNGEGNGKSVLPNNALRFPILRAHDPAGARGLCGDVALQPRRRGQRSAHHHPRRSRQQPLHLPRQERAFLQRPQRPRHQHRLSVSPARIARLSRPLKRPAHALGNRALARHLREAPREEQKTLKVGRAVPNPPLRPRPRSVRVRLAR